MEHIQNNQKIHTSLGCKKSKEKKSWDFCQMFVISKKPFPREWI